MRMESGSCCSVRKAHAAGGGAEGPAEVERRDVALEVEEAAAAAVEEASADFRRGAAPRQAPRARGCARSSAQHAPANGQVVDVDLNQAKHREAGAARQAGRECEEGEQTQVRQRRSSTYATHEAAQSASDGGLPA